MEGVTLLAQARDAGLTVEADGDLLRIRGPRRLEPLARRLLVRKAAVLAALRGETKSDQASLTECVAAACVNPGWTPTAWAGRLRGLAERCEAIRPELAAQYREWATRVTDGSAKAPLDS